MQGLSGLGGLLGVTAGQSFGLSGGLLPVVGALGGGLFGGTSGMISGVVMGLTAWMSQENEETTTEEQITNNSFVRNAPVPICYGTNKYAGMCIAIGELSTGVVSYGSGGKGGLMGGSEEDSESVYYYAEFAVAFAEGPIYGFADVFINDESVTDIADEEEEETDPKLSFSFYYGSNSQTTDPEFASYMTDGTALPWRYTAYLYCSGIAGYYAALPVISAEVVGFLTDTRGNITLDWEFDNDQYDWFTDITGSFYNLAIYTYNDLQWTYGYSNGVSQGAVYCWDASNPTVYYQLATNGEFSFGSSANPYNCTGHVAARENGNGDRLYILQVRMWRAYDLFYINLTDNSLVSVVKGGTFPQYGPEQPPDYDPVDYLNSGCCLRPASMEIVGDYIYLFGEGGKEVILPLYTACANALSAFVAVLSKDSGILIYIPTLKYLPESYLSGGPFHVSYNCITFILDGLIYCQWMMYSESSDGTFMEPSIYHFRTWKFCLSGISVLNEFYAAENNISSTNMCEHRHAQYEPIYFAGYYYTLVIQFLHPTGTPRYYFMRFPYGTVPNWYNAGYELLFEDEGIRYYTTDFPFRAGRKLILYNGALYFYVPRNATRNGSVIYRYNGIDIQQDSGVILEDTGGSYNQQLEGYMYSSIRRASFKFPYNIHVPLGYVVSLDCLFSSLKDAVPVEVVYDFMTNTRYGMGIPTSYFDGSPYIPGSGSWRTEYEFCLEPIDCYDYKGQHIFESRFLYSKEFTDKFKAYDLINEVLQTCRGFIYYCGGKIKVKIEKDSEEPIIHFGNYQDTLYTGGSLSDDYVTIDDLTTLYPLNFWVGDLGTITFYDEGYGSWYYGDTGYGEDTDGVFTEEFIICSQDGDNLYFCDSLSSLVPEGATFFITKDNMKKGTFTYSKKSALEKSNRFRLEFCNRSDEYRTDYIEKENIYDMEVSGELKEITYQMMGIKRDTQASRMISFLEDYETQINWNCAFETDIAGMLLCIGDIVGVTSEITGWTGKLFRIIDMEESVDYEVRLSLIEYVPSVYSDILWRFLGSKRSPFHLTGKYDTPLDVVNFHGIESHLSPVVDLSISRPDNSPFWAGAIIYHSLTPDDASSWYYIGKIYNSSPSVTLSQSVGLYDITIYYDPDTSYGGAFPANGSFFIEDEEIWYNEIDDTNNCFLYCSRGFNGTQVVEHTVTNFCIGRIEDIFEYEYLESDIGTYNYFKAISFSSFGIYADGADAPIISVYINKYYVIPKPVGSLMIYRILR